MPPPPPPPPGWPGYPGPSGPGTGGGAWPAPVPPPWPGPGAAAWPGPTPRRHTTAPVSDDDPPSTPRQGATWFLYAVFGFLAGQVASTVVLLVVAAANGHSGDVAKLAAQAVPPAWVVVSGLVGLWAGFIGAVVFTSRTRGTRRVRRDMRLEVRWSDLLLGPVVGLVGQLVLLPVLYVPLEHAIPNLNSRLDQPAKHLTGGFPGADLAVIAVLTVVAVPVIEETFFRGLVLRGLLAMFKRTGRVLGPVLAVVTDGVVFGLAHFEPLELLGLAAFGAVLAVLALRLGRLGPCIFAHATFNLIAILSVAYPTGVLR